MNPPTHRAHGALVPPSPQGVRAVVGKVLRTGVIASAVTLLTGYVLGVVRQPEAFRSHAAEKAHLRGLASFPHSLVAVWNGIGRGSGEAVIVAGLLMLIGTPVAGLVASALAFARRRDWLFTAIAATVFGVILGSFLIGSLAG